MFMYIQIELSDAIIDAIKSGETKTLSCKISVKPKQKKGRKKKVVEISQNTQQLIDYWNNHPKRSEIVGNRNLPFDDEQKKDLTRIKEAIDNLGYDNIISKIDLYQEQCRNGGYLKQDRNLAYKTLGSFCSALLKDTVKWWLNGCTVVDNDPELTFWIADSFAAWFLSRKTFGLVEGTSAYENFYKTQKVLDKIQKIGYNKEDSLRVLFRCLKTYYGEKTIFPGTLCSDNTIKVLLPQYLKKIGK